MSGISWTPNFVLVISLFGTLIALQVLIVVLKVKIYRRVLGVWERSNELLFINKEHAEITEAQKAQAVEALKTVTATGVVLKRASEKTVQAAQQITEAAAVVASRSADGLPTVRADGGLNPQPPVSP